MEKLANQSTRLALILWYQEDQRRNDEWVKHELASLGQFEVHCVYST